MHIQTVGGLIGAKTTMELVQVPLKASRQAEQKGDDAAVGRAVDFAGTLTRRANVYKGKAYEGMQKDIEAIRERERILRDQMLERRIEKQERQKMNERQNNASHHANES